MCDSSKLPKKKKVFANDAQINIYTVNGQFSFQTQMDLGSNSVLFCFFLFGDQWELIIVFHS